MNKFCKLLLISVLSTAIFPTHSILAQGKDTKKEISHKESINKLFVPTSKSLTKLLAGKQWQQLEALITQAKKQEKEGKKAEAELLWKQADLLLKKFLEVHPVSKLKNGDVTIGKITLHKSQKKISFPAKLIYNKEMYVEVLICNEHGRKHETLFTTKARPLHLQTLLHLLGAKNGKRTKSDPKIKQGDIVNIDVAIKTKKGKALIKPIEDFLITCDGGNKIKRTGWVFVGSEIYNGHFIADKIGELVLTWTANPSIIEPVNDKIASGEIKVDCKKVEGFPDNSDVRIIFTLKKKKVDPKKIKNKTTKTKTDKGE